MPAEKTLQPPSGRFGGHFPAGESTGAIERRHWSSFLRQDETARAVSALQGGAGTGMLGVAVFGPWGVGKTTLARAVETELAPTHHVVRIFGSDSTHSAPFDAFALHLARLPVTVLQSAAGIVEGISGLLKSDAGTRPVLFVLDELPALDRLSLAVIMHQLLSGSARILVLAREPRQLPEDLALLLKDGQLEEIRLRVFTHGDVRVLMSKATGALVSEAAVSALHTGSNGNPLVLEALFDEQLARGTLLLNRGVWVIDGPLELGSNSTLNRIVTMRLNEESALVREGVQRMALLRQAPLAVVIKAVGDDAAHAMEEAGLLDIGPGGANTTKLRDPFLGDVLRGQLSTERKAALHAEISEAANLHMLMGQPEEVMSLAAWVLEAQLPLAPSYALVAAREANGRNDPTLALACAALIRPGEPLWLHAVHAGAQAHILLGEPARAVGELEAAANAAAGALDPADQGWWLLTLSVALLATPGGAAALPGLIERAASDIAAASGSAAQKASAGRSLRLAHCLLAVHEGRFAQVVDELVEGAAYDADPNFALDCACLLVPALAAVGREVEAVALGRRTMHQATLLSAPLKFAEQCRQGLVAALLWSGQWEECQRMLDNGLHDMAGQPHHRIGVWQLDLGLAQVLAGHGQQALGTLTAACAQLERHNDKEPLGLAHSALALAQAQIGNEAESSNELRRAKLVGLPAPWLQCSLARAMQWMALQWLDEPSAVEEMGAAAMADLAQGRFSPATHLHLERLWRGSDGDYALLAEAAGHCQGPLSRLSGELARGAREHDAAIALSCAELARDMGNAVLECRLTAMATDFARESGDLVLARNARRLHDALRGQLPAVPMEPDVDGAELTRRERQIAKLARRGMGNRDIAERIGVSVRTVEGHLYQAYNKLGVASRNELEKLLEL